jgi:hypothetical protein
MDQPLNADELQGTWVLREIDGRSLEVPKPIYFTIKDGVISGFDGCNSFGGPLNAPARIRMGQRGCPEDVDMLPLNLSRAAEQLAEARIYEDRMKLPIENGSGVAVFERQTP